MPKNPGEDFVRQRFEQANLEGGGRPKIFVRWIGLTRAPIPLFGFSPMRPFAVIIWFYAWGLCIGPHWAMKIRTPKRD